MKKIIFLIIGFLISISVISQTLAEKLGYKNTDRLLIINCDDAGMCSAANLAAVDGQKNGLITSTTIMVPCPESDKMIELAKSNSLDAGIHLTHTAEWKKYRWGPVTPAEKVSGLIDKEGYLWRSIEEVYINSTPLEAYRESKAQIQKAVNAGLKITHIDSHMGTLQLSPPYVDVYLELATEFNVPVRMASQETLEKYGQADTRKRFEEKGILFPDYFIYEELNNYTEDDIKTFWTNIIKSLKPGVTELFIHASVPDEKLKSITDSWKTRNAEYELFTNDKEFAEFVKDEGILLIGYKALLELQRNK
ncbi:MAG: polysaccharide deacetylase family protein [Prolixibacteraceae bacterium]|nr:polysaccharide deacetylase family protein [Prolixibacteraceae bacterium]